jgi:DtxR family transcriptional regulator, Mn-dependent transcriptional regulator
VNQAHVEEYLGAIYRLRESSEAQLPLSSLKRYLNYSPISIHEMVQKLKKKGLLNYKPYVGVTLTKEGEQLATAIVRRHRIWECFLTESISLGWDQAHEIAGQLEHAAPEMVTEKLAAFLKDPQKCPHGNPIPTAVKNNSVLPESKSEVQPTITLLRMDQANPGLWLKIIYISPEISSYLKKLNSWGIQPGVRVEIIKPGSRFYQIKIKDEIIKIPKQIVQTLWVKGID